MRDALDRGGSRQHSPRTAASSYYSKDHNPASAYSQAYALQTPPFPAPSLSLSLVHIRGPLRRRIHASEEALLLAA